MRATDPPVVAVRTATLGRPGHASEDRVFTTPNAVIVLDGASQPDPSPFDGGWLADTLGRELSHAVTSQGRDLAEALADSIDSVARQVALAHQHYPSTTVSIVRWSTEDLEVLVLGDSPVIVLTRDGPRQVRDDRLDHANHRISDSADRATPGFTQDDGEAWRSLVDRQRRMRNQPGSYWIADANPEAAYHAVRARWHTDEAAAVLAMTDGASAGVDRYGIPPTWQEAFALAHRSPARLLRTVQAAELSDPDGQRWPRSKRHDDKAVALVEFGDTQPLPAEH